MPKKCAVVGCRSGHAPKIKKRKHKETAETSIVETHQDTSDTASGNKIHVFGFPNVVKEPGLRKKG